MSQESCARLVMKLDSARNSDDRMKPVRMRVRVPVRSRQKLSTMASDRPAPTRQPSGNTISALTARLARGEPETRANIANCPPRLAPAVVPKMDGLTSGSRNTPWTTAPPVARAAPASKAAPTRVARRPSSVERSVGSARLP